MSLVRTTAWCLMMLSRWNNMNMFLVTLAMLYTLGLEVACLRGGCETGQRVVCSVHLVQRRPRVLQQWTTNSMEIIVVEGCYGAWGRAGMPFCSVANKAAGLSLVIWMYSNRCQHRVADNRITIFGWSDATHHSWIGGQHMPAPDCVTRACMYPASCVFCSELLIGQTSIHYMYSAILLRFYYHAAVPLNVGHNRNHICRSKASKYYIKRAPACLCWRENSLPQITIPVLPGMDSQVDLFLWRTTYRCPDSNESDLNASRHTHTHTTPCACVSLQGDKNVASCTATTKQPTKARRYITVAVTPYLKPEKNTLSAIYHLAGYPFRKAFFFFFFFFSSTSTKHPQIHTFG